jgi:hypothetical protein
VVSFIGARNRSTKESTDRPAASHCQTLSHNVVSSTARMSRIRTHNVRGDMPLLCPFMMTHNATDATLLHHENKQSLMCTSFTELRINRGNCQKERSIFTSVSYVPLWDLIYRHKYLHIWIRVSERLLLIVHSAIFQPYHGENKLIFNEMMMILTETTFCG